MSLPVLAQEIIFTDGFEGHPPLIISSPILSGKVGEVYIYDVDAVDIDGDTLLYLLTTAPKGMDINAVSGELAWTPDAEGSFPVTVEVTDPGGGIDIQTWSIDVAAGQDSDLDGLADFVEGLLGTDPNDPDSDDDGLKDGEEVNTYGTNPLNSDSDNDGLTDGNEVNTHSTNPTEIDTDGDYFGDGLELGVGTDPLNPNDFPSGPPDPAAIATAIDSTVSTTLFGASSFLYEHEPPVQVGVIEGTIDPLRVAVLRGAVKARDGAPLPGVSISIHHHSEFGQTQSRVDGQFDMVVNGGGFVTIDFKLAGYLPVQRQVEAPWQDYLVMLEVVMIPLDMQVTSIDLASGVTLMAEGSTSIDGDGQRHAAIVFPAGTTAELMLEDGTTQPISSLNIRATEYTVGENGPAAMPGKLPPASAYTYAVELSADEAFAEGVAGISFNQPVYNYVENFLGFPVGSVVPSGYYDRENARWVASVNGLVIKIISITAGMVDVDIDGDDVADTGSTLSAIDFTDGERQSLATAYTVGQSLWRVPISHFTPWDHNLPYGPPFDAFPPRIFGPAENKDPEVTCGVTTAKGSIIECQNQVVGERVPIIGTPFTLNYRSLNVPGRKTGRTLDIRVSNASVPASLKRIDLELTVAGQSFKRAFSPQPNQSTTFVWNGKDAYQREISGRQKVTGSIGYVYETEYYTPAEAEKAFDQYGRSPFLLTSTRQDITLYQPFRAVLGGGDSRSQGLGGWMLDVHKTYDPESRVLSSGSGSTRGASSSQNGTITLMAGLGPDGFSGDGGPATEARFSFVSDVFVMPDGGFLVADSDNHRIRHISPQGIISTIAGNGSDVSSGDGGPATAAGINYPSHVTMGPDGSIYISEFFARIRKISPDGIISTFAGTGVSGFSGDGGLAKLAQISGPRGITVAPDGSVYFVDLPGFLGEQGERIRKIGTDGIIESIAGNATGVADGGQGPAKEVKFRGLSDIAIGPNGNIFVSSWGRVQVITPDGIIQSIAGDGTVGQHIDTGDGGPAWLAYLDDVGGIAVSKTALYIATGSTVRKVDSDGIITTVAGNIEGGYPSSGDGGPPLAASLDSSALSLDPQERLYIADTGGRQIRRLEHMMPGFSTGDIGIAAQGGNQFYQFNSEGRHLRTYNTLTGAIMYEFAYTAAGLLESVTDGDGNVTTIQRDLAGNPTGILSPFGQLTALTTDINGYINSITNPANEKFKIKSSPGGLITQTTDARGRISTYTYDGAGLLTRQSDNANFSQDFVRTKNPGGFNVTRTTGLDRNVSYDVQYLPGGTQQNTNTAPDGSQNNREYKTSAGYLNAVSKTGMVRQLEVGPDPRFGMQAPFRKSTQVSAPGGPTLILSRTSEATLTNASNPLSFESITNTRTVDGKTSISMYTAASRSSVATSPTGRIASVSYDSLGRMTSRKHFDFATTSASYNTLGKLKTLVTGSGQTARSTSLTYGQDGFVASVVDPMGRLFSITRDEVGRSTVKSLPGGIDINFAFNEAGDLESLTPPGKPAYEFTYDLHGNVTSITPPVVTGSDLTVFTRNHDRQLVSIQRPGEERINYSYDPEGRLSKLDLTVAEIGTATYEYNYVTARQLESIVGPGNQILSYTYQGDLGTGITWSGDVTGSVSYSFDNSFRIAGLAVNANSAVVFSYNDDSLLTGSGDLSISRNPVNGLVDSTVLGVVSDVRTYNEFAEETGYSASANGVEIYRVEYFRDKLGRVTTKLETVEGATSTFDYGYGPRGQLTLVKRDDAVVESYVYDDNGNRINSTYDGVEVVSTFDNQDRLLTYGANSYEYTPAGQLLTRTEPGNQITAYDYDVIGNLLSVDLPDTTQVTYGRDGQHRRVQRQVNGNVRSHFLYTGVRPLAELDELGNVVSIFVYAEDSTPAYLIRGGINYRIITDQVGSVRLVTNSTTGTVMQQLDYDSFGNVTLDTNPGFQPFGFAGGMYDHLTGLVRFGYRDYDPQIGRWTAKDPIGFGARDTNLYRYVNNQPVNYRDISGTEVPQLMKELFDWWDDYDDDSERGKKFKRSKSVILKADEGFDKSLEILDEALRLRDIFDDPSLLDGLKAVEFFGCAMDVAEAGLEAVIEAVAGEWLINAAKLTGLPGPAEFGNNWMESGANKIVKGKIRYPDQDGNLKDTFLYRGDSDN